MWTKQLESMILTERLALSDTNSRPCRSIASLTGYVNSATAESQPSGEPPAPPDPATVTILPSFSTARIRIVAASAK